MKNEGKIDKLHLMTMMPFGSHGNIRLTLTYLLLLVCDSVSHLSIVEMFNEMELETNHTRVIAAAVHK